MTQTANHERGVREVESGIDPGIDPTEDEQAGDEGIDDVESEGIQDQKEPLDPPQQGGQK